MTTAEVFHDQPELFEAQQIVDLPTDGLVEHMMAEVDGHYAPPPALLTAVRRERDVRQLLAMPLDEVAEQAKSGNQDAFEALVRATSPSAYSLAVRLTGSVEDAQDVVQEAYLRAYRGLPRFRGDAKFSTWLHSIIINCANTALVKRLKHRHDNLHDEQIEKTLIDTSPQHDPEAVLGTQSMRERLQGALHELPAKLRAVVVLRDIYDLSHKQIAEQLGISEESAKVRLHRARNLLRDKIFPLMSNDTETE